MKIIIKILSPVFELLLTQMLFVALIKNENFASSSDKEGMNKNFNHLEIQARFCKTFAKKMMAIWLE